MGLKLAMMVPAAQISDALSELFGEAKIWPLGILLPGKEGYGIWGGNATGEDCFLLDQDGFVLLFSNVPALIAAIEHGSPGNFDLFPGYALLSQNIASAIAAGPGESSVAFLDYAEALDMIATLGEDREGGGVVVDYLDGLLDLARQTSETEIADVINGEGRPLRNLYKYIWDEVGDVAVDDSIADFKVVSSWLESRCKIVSPD